MINYANFSLICDNLPYVCKLFVEISKTKTNNEKKEMISRNHFLEKKQ